MTSQIFLSLFSLCKTKLKSSFSDSLDSDSSASGTDSLTWISWFCTLPGHEYFAEVAEDFIEDDFNLTGLMALVPFYKEALEMILDVEAGQYSWSDSLTSPLTIASG